jgi:hypothetical protein
MGFKNPTPKLKYFKDEFRKAFSYYKHDRIFISKMLMAHGNLKNDLKDIIGNIYHVTCDMNLLMTPILCTLSKVNSGMFGGKELVYSIMYIFEDYMTDLCPHFLQLSFDGDPSKRPKPKDLSIRPKRKVDGDEELMKNMDKEEYEENIDNILVNDTHFPSDVVWHNNRGNPKFRKKVYAYLSNKIITYCMENYKRKTLENLVIRIENGYFKKGKYNTAIFSPYQSLKIIYRNNTLLPCEGEQVIFNYIRKIALETEHQSNVKKKKKKTMKGGQKWKLIFIVISFDSDCITYANEIMKRNKYLKSCRIEIHLRCKICKGNRKPGGKKKILSKRNMIVNQLQGGVTKTFYVIDIGKLRHEIKAKFGGDISNDISKVDWPTIIISILGAGLTGNDFTPGVGSKLGLSETEFKKSYKNEKGLIFQFEKNLINGFKEYINLKSQPLIKYRRKSATSWWFFYRPDESRILNILKRIKKKSTITKTQTLKLRATIRNMKWVLNYMSNPGNSKYVDNFDAVDLDGKSIYGYALGEDGKCYQTLNV